MLDLIELQNIHIVLVTPECLLCSEHLLEFGLPNIHTTHNKFIFIKIVILEQHSFINIIRWHHRSINMNGKGRKECTF